MGIKHELTSGDIGVMVSILGAVVGMTLYVSSVKANGAYNKENIAKIELQQINQDLRMDKLQMTLDLAVRNQTVVTALFEERTGKPLPKVQ